MAFYNSVLISTLIACVNSKIEAPFSPCYIDDIICLSTAKETFFSRTYDGIEKLDLLPIDPMTVAPLNVVEEEVGLAIHLKNTNVTGLKALKIADFKMDTDKKTVVLQMKSDIVIVSDADVELTKLEKTFNGRYGAIATVIGTSEYSYTIKEEDDTEYFELGPETNSCEIVGEPKVTLKIDLVDEADKEIYAKMPDVDKAALRKQTICDVVDSSSATIVHNLRAAAKAFPKSAFFKDA